MSVSADAAAANAVFPMDDSLSIINPFPKSLRGPNLLHELIAGPDSDEIALDYTDAEGKQTHLTYSELHARAEKLSSRLIQYRGRSGIIPLYISQCPSLYVSILAILKSGSAFCPLNLDVPEERLKFILKDTEAQVILTTSQLRPKLPVLQGIATISVDDEDGENARAVDPSCRGSIEPDNGSDNSLAYIMYTSGSTGLPKAVCLPHTAVTQSLLAHERHIPIFNRFLQFASPTFDVSVFEIFFPWIRGCTLVSCDRNRLLSDLPGMITSLNIDAAELTPSVAASLIRRRENVPTLKVLLTIGEMLNIQVIQEFGGSETQPSMLYGMYGPTEAAIHCTLQPSFRADMPAGTIGIPLDTVSCFIIKPAESAELSSVVEILPLGEVGELAVGGHQLASGYLNRVEQTRTAFITHPEFGPLYRTGDKARLLPNGVLECRGRISSGQVKLRGQRIELGEIEHAASKVSGCHAVVASVIAGQLVVFCIVEDDSITTDDIKSACCKWLPKYMVPSDIMLLKDFPYLPSGKVDKRKLESNYKAQFEKSIPDDGSISENLRGLMQVMKRILHVDLEPSSELGSAGLDSLKAIQVASELRVAGFERISALDLLASRTTRDLEALIQHQTSSAAASDKLAESKARIMKEIVADVLSQLETETQRQDMQEALPCTPLQDAMLSETARDSQAYCNSFELSLPLAIDLHQLREHLELLAEQHPLLRSGFCTSGVSVSTYTQVTWRHFSKHQVNMVEDFDHMFSISSYESLLRPLRVQCKETNDNLVLLFQIHHALYDQWSIEILLEDLNELLRGGQPPERPSFQAVNDFYLELKLNSDSQSDSIEFWQSYLADVVPGRVPCLTSEALPIAPLAVANCTMDVDMSVVREAAQDYGCSPHVVFQAAYAYLLSVYMGSSDVTFGTVFSGRTLAITNVENIFGPILSTLPTRVDISEARKLSDIIRKLQGDNREIMRHSTVSLADIRKVSTVSPGQSLFDSIFVWQETAREPSRKDDLAHLTETRDYLEFNLTLEMEPSQEGVKAKATYQPNVLSAEMANLLLQQLEQIVKDATENHDTLMSDVSQCLPTSLLSMANQEPQNFVYKQGLGSVIEKHALETPNKTALCFAHDIDEKASLTEELTYGELNARANRMAHFLISVGTLPDELVCICMGKSVDLFVGILAIAKAGAAYLPLDPDTPSSRIKQILSDARVKTCLTDERTLAIVSDMSLNRVVNVLSEDTSHYPESNPEISFDQSHLAYAVFTSGTTGRPKGVLVTQENILSNLTVLEKIYPVSEDSRLLQATTQAFDVSVFEIFFSWFVGICLCSATKDVLFRDLENSINQLEITHLSLTPTVAALIEPLNVPKVKFLVTAGEAVTHQVHEAWAGKGLYQGYGPSETTNICTVNPAVRSEHLVNNIGPAFENTSTFVLSSHSEFRPLPVGALGELCFGGQQVFRGYQNMEELTESKIIKHMDYGRIYRSGDLGRMLPDGTILIEGRIDEQRKLRGLRIELGEISGALLRSPAVHDCFVQIVGKSKQKEHLVAFWIPISQVAQEYSIVPIEEGIRKEINQLFNTISNELPAYMVPTVLIPLTTFPRTVQGKIDRKTLIQDLESLSTETINAFSQTFEDPSNAEDFSDVERDLIASLADVLKVPASSISRSMSFFAIGLDSVSAIRFSKAIKTSIGKQVAVSTILKRSSIARLAASIQEESQKLVTADSQQALSSESILSGALTSQIALDFQSHGEIVQSVLPCTPLQEAMLSASSIDSGAAYCNRSVFKLSGDVSRMKSCWKLMVERHEILRTAFVETDDAKFPYLQVVLLEAGLPWEVVEDELFNPETLLQPDTSGSTVSIPVFGFKPPFRFKLYRSASSVYVLLEMHHAMYDGNAMSNLLHEVEETYRGVSLPSPSKFAPVLDYMLATDLEAADGFFQSQLKQYLPKPFVKHEAINSHGFGLKKATTPVSQTAVQDFVRKHNISLIGLVQATWAKVLSISQGYSDICFGNVVSGRSVPVDGVQSLVAPCFNTVPVRIDLEKQRSNLALIKDLQKDNVRMLPYQLVPLRRIQANNSVRGLRLFDSLVLLQQESVVLDHEIWHLEGESGEMDFPCIVEFVPEKGFYDLLLHFDRSYFVDDIVPGKLCNAFMAAFSSCIRYPSGDVHDLVDFDREDMAGVLKPNETLLLEAKTALLERDSNTDAHTSSVEEWSPIESEIRQVFSAVSGTPETQVSRDTTIYRLGLDSISAIQVAARLRKQGFRLTVGDVMESPSCSQLASVVQSRTSNPIEYTPTFDLELFDQAFRPSVMATLGIPEMNIAKVRPCTAVQAGMISQYLQSSGEQYFNHTFHLLEDKPNLDQLIEAWTHVLKEHEMLRTGFVCTEDAAHPFAMVSYEDIAPASTCLQPYEPQKPITFEERQQAAFNAVQYDLHLPPWRWDLFDQDGRKILQFSAHHALFDAETLRLIQNDLRLSMGGEKLPRRGSIGSALSFIVGSSMTNKDEQQSFWARQLTDAPVSRFPDLSPVRVLEPQALVVNTICKIPKSDLEATCRDKGITLQAAGQAAWARLLAAYTGEPRVAFGVVYSGRTVPETASCPFPCITTLPIVANTSLEDEKLIHELMAYNAAVQRHQFTPLTDIQRYSGLSDESLFDTLFAFQKPLEEDTPHRVWKIAHESAAADYPISIEVESLPQDKLGFRLTMNVARIPTPQGQTILQQLESLLMDVLEMNTTNEESSLAIVPAKDPVLPSQVRFLHELVTSAISLYPERTALEFVTDLQGDSVISRQWTYRQLDEESNRIAQFLVQNGVKSNGVVAASFDKCPEASFAFLGILKAGCAFCAIDPTAPTARKTFILEDSKASILLTSATILRELEGVTECRVFDIVGNRQLVEEMSNKPISTPQLTPSSISYVLYTSGTTGAPKGCELTHDNSVQALLAFQRIFKGRWTESSRWLQFASYHFDVAVLEQFWTWSVGIRLVCAPRDLILEDLAGFIDTMRISHLDLTPSLGRLLDPALVPSLHRGVFITGGEAVKQDMIESWGDYGCLFNFYGPTECTIGVTTFPSVPRLGKPSNIGWQFDNVGTYVLAPGTKQPVLRGAIGELCISGRLVGKGYLNRSELTEDRFPHLELYNERVYRTGDLVRLLHDNSIEFLGRQDTQVKLRGQRLEIDEIEAVIRRYAEVEDVVCLVAKHPKQQKDVLVAFIGMSSKRKQNKPQTVSAETTRDLIGAARTACEEHLPGYMVPTHFIPIEEIPLSVNNKVEEKQLRSLYNSLSTSAIQEYSTRSQDDQALSNAEKIVARALATLLKIDANELQASSNIFALGLSSISAIQFSRKLKSEGFENASVATVMKNAAIGKLTKALNSSSKKDGGEIVAAKQSISACRQKYMGVASRVLGGKPDDYEAITPCTPLQQGVVSRSMNSESSLYFNTFRYVLQHVDIDRLRDAFQIAVAKTQILRAAFIETDDGFVQAVRKSMNLPWLEVNAPTEKAMDKILNEHRQKWRNSNSPHIITPFEVVISRTATQQVMEIHIHHALYDGFSYELLIENITRLYDDREADFGKPFTEALPYGPLRNVKGAKEFWMNHLAGAQRELMPSLSHETEKDVLHVSVLDQLPAADELRKSLNVTLQAVLQAAWSATLRKYYQGAIGNVVSGRSIDFDGADTVLGPLFNTIPFSPHIGGDDDWRSLVQQCHTFNISALPFQHTPVRDITKWCKGSSSEPLFDTLFVFQSSSTPVSLNSYFILEEASQFQADYPLSFEVEETAEHALRVTISAKCSICSPERAAMLIQEFSDALSAMTSAPGVSIGMSLSHDYTHTRATSVRRNGGEDLNGVTNFSWSPEAITLRSEIATLAAVDESEVDEHVSIFELGLDSVDAVKLSSRLKKKGLTVAVSALMRLHTIPRILAALTSLKPTAQLDSSKQLLNKTEAGLTCYAKSRLRKTDDIERVLPASPMQEGLVSEMIKSSYQAYFNHDVLKVSKGVDVTKLEEAWNTVVQASPILRTGFLEVDEPALDVTFCQIIRKPARFFFNRVELPGDNFQGYLEKTQDAFSSGSLSEPHFKLTLATTSSGCYLILSVAHALYDGYSLSLLHQDVYEAYHNQFKQRPSYDKVLEEGLYAVDDDSVSFWRSLLSGATRTHILPCLDSNPPQPLTYRKERVSAISSGAISTFCRKQGVTVQALCQASWTFTLAHYTQMLDVMYGVVLAGRDSQLAEHVMFPTMNTVVMRSVLHGSRLEMLQYMQGNVADIIEHQHFPLRRIQAACQKEVQEASQGCSAAFFDTLFTFQKRPEAASNISDALYESVNGASDVDYPVAVEAEMMDEGLIWRTACKNEVFTETESEDVLKHLDNVLIEIVSRPESASFQLDDRGISICGLPPFSRSSLDAETSTKSAVENGVPTDEVVEWTSEETEIRHTISQVTKTPEDEIEKRTSIQNLGIDSINAIKISSLLRKKAIKLSVSQIIRAGSITKMAKILQEQTSQDPASERVSSDQVISAFCARNKLTPERFGFVAEDVERLMPATAGQAYMLSAWQTTKGRIFFPEFEYTLTGDVSASKIQEAWKNLVIQHEILRTILCATDDEHVPFVQLVIRNPANSAIDLDGSDEMADAETQQPFVCLKMKKTEDGYKLGLKIHHALYDAVSLPLLMADFEAHLRSSSTAPLPASFCDFVVSTMGEDVAESRKNFWIEYLRGAQPRRLPRAEISFSSRRVESFNPSVMPMSEKQETVLRKKGLSIQALFFAAYAKIYSNIVSRNNNNNDDGDEAKDAVVIGIYMANRAHTDSLSNLAAPTVNLVPLLVRSPETTSLITTARRIQSDLGDIGSSVENSTVALWEIEKWTGVTVDTFVNFIKLPERSRDVVVVDDKDGEEEEEEEEGRNNVVVVTAAAAAVKEKEEEEEEEADQQGPKTGAKNSVRESSTAEFKQPDQVRDNTVLGSYPATLDIEATVANGALGIGVFGWQDMMGSEDADGLIGEIENALREELAVEV